MRKLNIYDNHYFIRQSAGTPEISKTASGFPFFFFKKKSGIYADLKFYEGLIEGRTENC